MQLYLVGTLVLIIFSTRTQAAEKNVDYNFDEYEEYENYDDDEGVDKYLEKARARRLEQQQLLVNKIIPRTVSKERIYEKRKKSKMDAYFTRLNLFYFG